MNIALHLFRPPVARYDIPLFTRVYEFWRREWSDVYREIGGDFDDTSDNLTRQHEIIVLTENGEPVAMVCHRFVNFQDPSLYVDSYFRTGWPPEALESLREKAREFPDVGAIGSQILVRRDLRREADPRRNFKALVSFASFQRVRDLGLPFTIGTVRADRGMDKVFETCGAQVLARGIHYHGATVALVYFAPAERPILLPNEFADPVRELWDAFNTKSQTRSVA